jgi:hypothetical protein
VQTPIFDEFVKTISLSLCILNQYNRTIGALNADCPSYNRILLQPTADPKRLSWSVYHCPSYCLLVLYPTERVILPSVVAASSPTPFVQPTDRLAVTVPTRKMGREPESGARGSGRGHASGRSSSGGGRSPFNGSNRNSNSSSNGHTRVPAKKPAPLKYKFTLKKEGKVQTTFASMMVMKITNLIQQTYEGGRSGAKARVPTFLRVVTFDRDLIISTGVQ